MTEFVPLATTVITLTEPIDIGITLGGRRLVCEIADAVWTGDRIAEPPRSARRFE